MSAPLARATLGVKRPNAAISCWPIQNARPCPESFKQRHPLPRPSKDISPGFVQITIGPRSKCIACKPLEGKLKSAPLKSARQKNYDATHRPNSSQNNQDQHLPEALNLGGVKCPDRDRNSLRPHARTHRPSAFRSTNAAQHLDVDQHHTVERRNHVQKRYKVSVRRGILRAGYFCHANG